MKTKNFFLPLLLAAMMCAPFTANAQVTIGSTDLPQAMLDIRAYPEKSERGQGFRLIDGNQAPGRVLTAGEDGVGTWRIPAGGTKHIFSGLGSALQQPVYYLTVPPGVTQTAVILSDDTYSFVLEPGFWRIDFNIPIVVLNPSVFTSERSSVELIVTATNVPYAGGVMPSPTFGTTFTTMHSGTIEAHHRAIGTVMIDTRGQPTQRYYLVVGRPITRGISDEVELQLLTPHLFRSIFATYTPEF